MHTYKSQASAWTRQPKRAGVGSSIKAAESGNCNLIDSWTWFPDAENGRLGPNVWGNPKLAQALSKGGWNPWRSGGYLTGFTWRAAQLRGPRPERRNRGTGTGQPIFWKLPFLAPLLSTMPPACPSSNLAPQTCVWPDKKGGPGLEFAIAEAVLQWFAWLMSDVVNPAQPSATQRLPLSAASQLCGTQGEGLIRRAVAL